MSPISRTWPYTALFGAFACAVAAVFFVIAAAIAVGGGEPKAFFALGVVSAAVGLMGWIAALWAIDTDGHSIRSLPLNRWLSNLQWFSVTALALAFVTYRGTSLASVAALAVLAYAAVVWLIDARRRHTFKAGDLLSIQADDGYDLALVRSFDGESVELLSHFAPSTARRRRAVPTAVVGHATSGSTLNVDVDELNALRPELIWRGLSVR